MASRECGQAEVLCERALADAGLASEQHVFSTLNEAKRLVQLLEELALNRARMHPVEAIERLGWSDRCRLTSLRKVARVTLAFLERGKLEKRLRRRHLTFGLLVAYATRARIASAEAPIPIERIASVGSFAIVIVASEVVLDDVAIDNMRTELRVGCDVA